MKNEKNKTEVKTELKIDQAKFKVGDKVRYCVDIEEEIQGTVQHTDRDGGETYSHCDDVSDQTTSMLNYLYKNIEFTIDAIEYRDYQKTVGTGKDEVHNFTYPIKETYKRAYYILKEIDELFYESDLEKVTE